MAITSAYNTPRVLGQVYNTVSYKPQSASLDTWYDCIDSTRSPFAPSVIAGTVTVTGAAANSKITFDASTGRIRFSDKGFNGHLTCDITVTTSDIPDGPIGHSFTYTVSVFTIGLGLPYFTGDHVLNYRVGDYVNFTLKPDAHTHKPPAEITFDVSGDMKPGAENTWTLEGEKPSGISAHKYTNDGPADDGIQTINFYGYARHPGIYRFTLTGKARHSGDEHPLEYTIPGGENDSESFLVNIRPYGPQPGQLYTVVVSPKIVKPVDPLYRFAAINTKHIDMNDALMHALTHSAPSALNFIFHNSRWDGQQPTVGMPAVDTSDHRVGYWTLDLTNSANTGAVVPPHYYFTLSCKADIWYLYYADTKQQSTWVVIAAAPAQYPNSIAYPPYFLAATTGNDFCADFYAKGSQNYYIENYGMFSYTGIYGNHRIYAQEPVYANWPNPDPVHVSSTAHNYVLWCLSTNEKSPNAQWILGPDVTTTQSGAVAILPGSDVHPNSAVAMLYATPRPNQNHGGVDSKDVVFSMDCDTSGGATSGGFTAMDSISNYAHISQLRDFGNNAGTGEDVSNGTGKFVWSVPNGSSSRAAGYMWTSYYSLLRFINFNTANLYLVVGGHATSAADSVDSSITSSCKGGESFPSDPSAYYSIVSGAPVLYTNMSRTNDSANSLVSSHYSCAWDCSNVSGAFNAWTGNLGYFKLAGWSPELPGGMLSVRYTETAQSTSIKETVGLALISADTSVYYESALLKTTKVIDFSQNPLWIEGAGVPRTTSYVDSTVWKCESGSCVGSTITSTFELQPATWEQCEISVVNPHIHVHNKVLNFDGTEVTYEVSNDFYDFTGGGLTCTVTSDTDTCMATVEMYAKGIHATPHVYTGPDGYEVCEDDEHPIIIPKTSVLGPVGSGGHLHGTLVVSWGTNCAPDCQGVDTYTFDADVLVNAANPNQSCTTDSQTADLTSNPFVSHYSINAPCGNVCITWGAAVSPVSGAVCNPLDSTGRGEVSGIASYPNNELTVSARVSSFSPPISGATVVSGVIAIPVSGGCYDYKTLVGWIAEGITKTYQATADIQYAAGMNKTDDVNGAWFSANVEVSDGPPVSGGLWRALYLTAAGCGHTNVAGGGEYETVVNYVTSTVTQTNSLLYSGGSYTIISSGADTSITSSSVTTHSVTGNIGCGYACCGGILQITGALDSGAKTVTGTKNGGTTNYMGNASLMQGEEIVLSSGGGTALITEDSFNNGGLRPDHNETSSGTGEVNGSAISGAGVVNRVKDAVNGVSEPSDIQGGWSGGVAYGSSLSYYKHEDSSTNTYNNTYKIGLELHS